MDRRRFSLAAAAAAALAPRGANGQEANTAALHYSASVLAVGKMMSWFFGDVARVISRASATTFVDDQWRVDVLAPFAVPQAARSVIGDFTPPSEFIASHELFAESIENAVLAGEFMEHAVLDGDPEALETSVRYLERASELIVESTAALPDD